MRSHQVRQRLCLADPAGHDGDVRRTGQPGLDDDGPCRTAGTENAYSRAGRVAHRPKGANEALAVGVLSGQHPVGDHDAVDRTDDPSRLGQPVEVLDHRDLVRDRAVEAGPAHRAGAAHGVAQVGGSDVVVDVARWCRWAASIIATVGFPAAGWGARTHNERPMTIDH